MDSSLTQYDSEQDLDSPEALIPWNEESSKEDKPFLPRFLLQESNEGYSHNRPCLPPDLLCSSDWLRLRGISETECLVLPIRELAAIPRCSLCERLNASAPVRESWAADASCRLDSSLTPQYESELDFGPPGTVIPRDEESSEEDKAVPAKVFAAGDYLCAQPGLCPNWPSPCRGIFRAGQIVASLAGNFRDRSSILLLQCVPTAQGSGTLSAPWPLSMPVLLDGSRGEQEQVPWYGRSGRVESPSSQRTDSVFDSKPDLWKWDLDVAGDFCPRVPRPVPQPAVQFWQRLLLRELILAHSRPILAVPSVEVSSPNPSECATIMFQATVNCGLGPRSPVCLLSAGQTIRGLALSLTLIPAQDVLTVFAPATFWLRGRLLPKKEQ